MRHLSPRSFHLLGVVATLLDFLCFQAALLLGYWLWMKYPWHDHYQLLSDFAPMLLVLPSVAVGVFRWVGLYKPEMGVLGVQEQSHIFKGIWITYLVALALSFFYRSIEFSRLAIFYSLFISSALVSLERFFFRRFLDFLNQKGIANRQALIYGAGYHGQRLERWIQQSPHLGVQIVGYLDDNTETLVKKPEHSPLLGGIADLKKLIKTKNVSLLFLAHRALPEKRVIEIFQLCRKLEIHCWAIPSLYQFHVERAQLQNIGGIPLVGFREGFSSRFYEQFKRVLDLMVSVLLGGFLAPLLSILSVGVYLNLGRPILFKQIRVGKNGKKFTIYKFRTLRKRFKKSAVSPELQKAGRSIDPFSAFLRKSGLDELPQILNVLKGEMSLIGPRPEMPFIVEKYGPLERERLSIKPGITGLWQISRDRKRLLIHENMDYDLYYLEHLSLNLDLAILVKTFWAVMGRVFSRVSRRSAETKKAV